MGSNPTPSARTKMPGLSTPESGIPEEVLAGWRIESGHKSEEDFETFLTKQGVEELDKDPAPEKAKELVEKGRIAFRRATAKEDFEKGIDFHFFNPLTGGMVTVDISTSGDPKIHAKKREKERQGGPRFLPLKTLDLTLAARGAERNGNEIWRSVNVLLLEDALDQARSGEIGISQPQVAQIERKLEKLQKTA